jgi:hypothetical protein
MYLQPSLRISQTRVPQECRTPVRSSRPGVLVCDQPAPAREKLEHYIAGVFAKAYGAEITGFMPLLAGLQQSGVILAALGLRSAAPGPLFCEHYLDQPVEACVAELYGVHAERQRIMELGNLAVTRPGHSAILYLLAAAGLAAGGVDYLLFAANGSVRRSLARCGFTPREVRPALAARLPDGGRQWGSYYASQPVVMLCDVGLSLRQAGLQPAMATLLAAYEGAVGELAAAIERQRR